MKKDRMSIVSDLLERGVLYLIETEKALEDATGCLLSSKFVGAPETVQASIENELYLWKDLKKLHLNAQTLLTQIKEGRL